MEDGGAEGGAWCWVLAGFGGGERNEMGGCTCRWNDSMLYESRSGCCGIKVNRRLKSEPYSSDYPMRTGSELSILLSCSND